MPLALTGFALQSVPLRDSTALLRVWLPFPLHVMTPPATAGVLTNGLLGSPSPKIGSTQLTHTARKILIRL